MIMKKLIPYILIFNFMMVNIANAADMVSCPPSPLLKQASLDKICHDIDDVICKKVPVEERRSCSDKEQSVLHNAATGFENYSPFKCLEIAGTSLYDLVMALLKQAISFDSIHVRLLLHPIDTSKKMHAEAEATRAFLVDMYEASRDSSKRDLLWGKIADKIGPLVASFDCLSPKAKANHVCGFVLSWIAPPAILAKILLGTTARAIQADAKLFEFLGDETLVAKYGKAVAEGDIATINMIKFQGIYKKLGYTEEEFNLIVQKDLLKNTPVESLKPVNTAEGTAQRHALLNPSSNTLPPRMPQSRAVEGTKPFHEKSEYLTIKAADGSSMPAEIVERFVKNGREVAVKIRFYDPKTGKMIEARMSEDSLSRLTIGDAGTADLNRLIEGYSRNPQFRITPIQLREAEQAYQEPSAVVKPNAPKPVAAPVGIEANELNMTDDQIAQVFGVPSTPHTPLPYVADPKASNLPIIKAAETKKPKPEKPKGPRPKGQADTIVPSLESDYITVRMKNDMGLESTMSAKVTGRIIIDGIEKYIVQVFDDATQSFNRMEWTERELRNAGAKADLNAKQKITTLNPSFEDGASFN
jgi:hypothetical protein